MKIRFLVCLICVVFLQGCVSFKGKQALFSQERYVAHILEQQNYWLEYGSVKYYTTKFDHALNYYGKARHKGVLGYFVVNIETDPPKIYWSEDGSFPELELEWLVNAY